MSGAAFARYANDLLKAATGIDAMGKRVMDRVGRGALETARDLAPVESGDLERSVTMKREGLTVTLESDLYYARFQEFGTSRMAPNPFMGPTLDRWTPRLIEELERGRDELLEGL